MVMQWEQAAQVKQKPAAQLLRPFSSLALHMAPIQPYTSSMST
jgi:hypothetical protein